MSLNDVDAVLLTHPLPQQGFGKAQGFAWLNDVNVVFACFRGWNPPSRHRINEREGTFVVEKLLGGRGAIGMVSSGLVALTFNV